MNENLCARCETPNRPNAKFCVGCGALLFEEIPSAKETPVPKLNGAGLDTSTVLQGRYRLITELGRGGFGAVYKAWDSNLNKACAIKENLEASPAAYRQFVREATVLSNLSHPNLPRVTDHFFIQDKGQYLVMDFVEGEDLMNLLKRRGTLPIEQVRGWVLQVAEALVYLHSRQPPVIHRDIKPSNIRITPDGRALLVDFGLVKVFDPNLKTTLGARAVTPGYAPPEQYGHGKTDVRTDIYALGATLYNLIAGRDPLESVQRMAGIKLPSAYELNPQVPLELIQVIERAMALEPSQRFQSASDFVSALKHSTVPSASSSGSWLPKEKVFVRPTETAKVVRPVQEPASSHSMQFPGTQTVMKESNLVLPTQNTHKWINQKAIGVLILVALLLCAGAAVGYTGWTNQQEQNEHATQEAQALATQERQLSTARAGATITKIFKNTSTANALEMVNSTSTAKAGALQTAQAKELSLAGIIADRVLVFGPASGYLIHNPDDDRIEYFSSEQELNNFILEVRFFNPYAASEGDWDFGIVFRANQNGQFRVEVESDSSWELFYFEDDFTAPAITSSTLTNLDVNEGESNWIRIICKADWGIFYLNGTLIDELDLSKSSDIGDIWVGTGMKTGNTISGKSTYYQDFTVWSIP